MLRALPLLLLALLQGCRCGNPISTVADADLTVSPESLTFPDTWVGRSSQLTVELTNRARVSGHVTVTLDGSEFSVDTHEFDVAGGDTVQLTVHFTPTMPGAVTGTLALVGKRLTLQGTGVDVPMCEASTCHDSTFDFDTGSCVSTEQAMGTSCSDPCLQTGSSCIAGECLGTARDCGDGDACTVDACANGGCLHVDRMCPAPTSPCRISSCDSATGCGETEAPDGTLCGADSCLDANVSVCISGQCVVRTRPQTRRCTNTWVPQVLLEQSSARLAWDPVGHQVITFVQNMMWAWDGTGWRQLFPPELPPTSSAMMTTDTRRQRVVLFDKTSELWEWDGSTWINRVVAGQKPSARSYAGFTYDSQRRRLVLFGGSPTGPHAGFLNDLWEFDGASWSNPSPNAPSSTTQPPSLASMGFAYDPVRQVSVLFGGNLGADEASATWTWNGTNWTHVITATTPPARSDCPLAFDPVRGAITHVGGYDYDPQNDVWTFDGTDWTQRTAVGQPMSDHGLVFDPDHQRLLALYRGALWSWDQQSWSSHRDTPPSRSLASASFDHNAQGIVLFGGLDSNVLFTMRDDTWLWSNRQWSQQHPSTHPVGRYGATQAWDPVAHRTLFFGGSTRLNSQNGVVGQDMGDTWSYDGAQWTQLNPPTSPPAGYPYISAWDTARSRWVMVTPRAVWEFDGATWSAVDAGAPNSASANVYDATLAYDEDRAQMLYVSGTRTSTWNGASWSEEPDAGLPANSANGVAAWDGVRHAVVLVDQNSSWSWDGAHWVDLAPTVNASAPLVTFDAVEGRLVSISSYGNWTYLP